MNTLTAKEIKQGMTQGEWDYLRGQIYGVSYITDGGDRWDNSAIVTAVNGTYGKNLDPEKYEQVVKAAEKFQKWLKEFDVKGLNDAELSLLVALEVKFEEEVTAALQAAKIK